MKEVAAVLCGSVIAMGIGIFAYPELADSQSYIWGLLGGILCLLAMISYSRREIE